MVCWRILFIWLYIRQEKNQFKKKNFLTQKFYCSFEYIKNYQWVKTKLLMNIFWDWCQPVKKILQELSELVVPYIQKQYTNMREPISPAQRLSCTLVSSVNFGVSFEDLKFITVIAPKTLWKIIIETCQAIITVLKDNIKVSNFFLFLEKKYSNKF